ncbi:MAG: ecdysteroid 22-kinase family protein [Anaerolineae bacterium]|nr:ecdysteroid 22-kinase family protein [Anaerolineae bacterium]
MAQVITDIEQVTPDWLTDRLQNAGTLTCGGVTHIDAETSRPFGSIVSRLKLTYSADAPDDAPRKLFLKVADPDAHRQYPGRGKREIEFYGAIPAGDYARLPLPRCYDAVVSDEGFHLLLDDLTDSHVILPHPFPPSWVQCEQVVDALARLHAYWWNDARLGVSMGRSADQKTVFNGDEEFYPAFADFLGEALWDERRAIFERAMEASPRLHDRLRRGSLTLIHGDAHAWNFLYPRDPADPAVLVDWEAWDADVGVFDLAYLIALFWFAAHRARMEKTLVERYHEKLVASGVVGYSWDDCWNDYRHAVIRLLFRPVWWWRERRDDQRWAEIWWPRLERIICAYQDLNCEELLS